MEEKVGEGGKGPDEKGAVAPESPQEHSGLVVMVGGQVIPLSAIGVQDFPLTDIITGGTPAGVLERARAKYDLISVVLSRSKLTPEQVEILKLEPLATYKAVGAAIMQELFGHKE